MNKNKAYRMVLAVVLVALLVWGGMTAWKGKQAQPLMQGNLLRNGDFAQGTDGMPSDWQMGMWVTSAGASYLEAVQTEDGRTAVLIENVVANDARFEQTVSVQENATYRLSARVKAENCAPDELGANVSFLGVYGSSEDVHDTEGAWQKIALYAHTGRGQKEVTVCVRLGGYGSETTGRAWFTDVVLEQVEAAPVGTYVLDLATPTPQKEQSTVQKSDKETAIPLLLLTACVYLLGAGWVARKTLTESPRPIPKSKETPWVLPVILLGAWVLRTVLSGKVAGYGVDMGCFAAWAGKMASGGPQNFYEMGYFCDYPPAYLLVLGVLGRIAKVTGVALGSMGGQVLLKTVPILCDILLSGLIYEVAKRLLNQRVALGLAVLMAFNPAYILAGACWGQIDAVLTLILVGVLLCARQGLWQGAIPLFAWAVLIKPQAGLLVPLGLVALLKDGITRRETRKRIGLGLLLGVAVTGVIVAPFSVNQTSPMWLVEKYQDTLSSYAYATLSTGNLMFLLGGNWVPNDTAWLGTLTYGQLGAALMVLSFGAGIAVYLRGTGRKRLYLASAVTLQGLFVLGSKMHERYILPALVLLMLAYMEEADWRLLGAMLLSTVASAVNIGIVLTFEHLVAPNLGWGYGIALVQLVALGLTIWAAVDLTLGHAPKALRLRSSDLSDQFSKTKAEIPQKVTQHRIRRELLQARDYRLHLNRIDGVLMLVLTLAYGVVGFYQLGEMKAPQTGYTSTAKGEYVVLDLGESHQDFHVYYYGGISDTQFSFATSEDGVQYTEEIDAYFDRGECFKWQAMRMPRYTDGVVSGASGGMLGFDGRYLRVTFDGAASALWEVAAVDADGNVIRAVSAEAFAGVDGRMSEAGTLIDEQDTVPAFPSYLNSMYFDEIYHGRTGYEHAHSLYTYETTHPPLGKVFMSWCIRLMGMTPFAWRFAGALCGVLMIPVMYLLAKQLLGSSLWAGLCALLLSADCMHFTQTRIATIDSFPVLFMMLMFLFMARWMKMSFFHQRLRDTWVPLALSGICMGLAIASKWIGCYGAVGLAVLFFGRFYQLWKQFLYAKEHRQESPAFAQAADSFGKKAVQTLGACVVFFVLIPIVIYVLSYIPYLRAYGEIHWNGTTFKRIWDAQVLMFDYHKNLVAEHYFASPWYEWPLIVKPMWYYNADFKGAGMASSILSFGNPAVWWTGLVGMIFALGYCVYRCVLPAFGVLHHTEEPEDKALPVLAIGFLSAYLPWVLVSRLTFIYHYFASVPWIIIATALGLNVLSRRHARTAKVLAGVLAVLAVGLFVAFYPLASGMEVPRAWCDGVNWFNGWMWY